jgi:hypothetical protein
MPTQTGTRIVRRFMAISKDELNSVDDWEQWVYRIGLKLDGVITLKGMTNAERIEAAINDYIAIIKKHPSIE